MVAPASPAASAPSRAASCGGAEAQSSAAEVEVEAQAAEAVAVQGAAERQLEQEQQREREEEAVAEGEAEDVVLDLPTICEEPQITGNPGALRRSRQGRLGSSMRASGRVRRSAVAGGGGAAGPGGVRESIPLFVLQAGAANAGLLVDDDEDGTDEFLDEEFLAMGAASELPLEGLEEGLEEEEDEEEPQQQEGQYWQEQQAAPRVGGPMLAGRAQRVQAGAAERGHGAGAGWEAVEESALSSPALSEASG